MAERPLNLNELEALPAPTHLAVTRPTGYDHHGIYVGDGQVFELMKDGSGRARMQLVPIDLFARGHRVSLVQHGGREVSPFRHFDADPPHIVLDRIRRLLAIGDVGQYNLWGLNCEHVAVWCMTGIADSIQVRRRWFRSSWIAGETVLLAFAFAIRARKVIPPQVLVGIVVFSALRMIPVAQSHLAAWRFTSMVSREQPPTS